ncbi:MAG: hypothetical protein HPY69_18610 [Armatimonadetes bacterium]|nr:hypothetical protein [Armatimonadota bacterium]
MAKPGRHLDFFALMEELPRPGCPVCRLADRAEHRFLEVLFYEHINDGHVRARLRETGGFCRRHTQAILEAGDALGSSLLFGDLLRGGKQPPGPCPACQAGAEAARRAERCLLQHFLEPDVAAAYRAGGGLCRRHLDEAMRSHRSAASQQLLEVEEQRTRQLAAECAEFVAKTDYRRAGEPLGREGTAWRRAARKLGGGYPLDGAE